MRAKFLFSHECIQPYLVFPFDKRWIYYSKHPHFLDRHGPELAKNRQDNEFLVTVPEPRKVSESRPLFSSILVGLHVHERGSVVIPRDICGDDLLAGRDANLPESAWRVLREHLGLSGERRDDDARRLAGDLIRVALAVLHAPAYQVDHRSALSADWAHLPVPKDVKLFDSMVKVGDIVARLLNTQLEALDCVRAVLGDDRFAALALTRKLDGSALRPEDLNVTIKYRGGAKGRWVARPFVHGEYPHVAWGNQTGDLYISDKVFFSNVPEVVWKYELRGYPVLKKWLGYRQSDRRNDQPLTVDDRRWFRSVVLRIAALLVLSPRIDELYSAASEDAFTATELGIKR